MQVAVWLALWYPSAAFWADSVPWVTFMSHYAIVSTAVAGASAAAAVLLQSRAEEANDD